MRISFFDFIALLTLGIAAANVPKQEADARLLPVQAPAHKHDNANDLLSTLEELHQSLIQQIALLENMKRSSDMNHLLLHYTAQKNNIEQEISLIKSIEANPTKATAPRHILKNLAPEERIFNIFRKNRNPSSTEELSNNDAYPLPYPPYYIPNPYVYPYPGPPKPDYPYPNDLIEGTFPGYEPQPNHHQQTFTNKEQPPRDNQMSPMQPPRDNQMSPMQPPRDNQMSPMRQPTLQVPQKNNPLPQVTLQSQVQPTKPKPQRPLWPQWTQRKPKPQIESPESQPSEKDTQTPQYGQKQGVFIYYPDGVITDDDERERPTIGGRFGQAFDRFGQVISNLANRQTLRPINGSDEDDNENPENIPAQHRVKISLPRSSNDRKLKARKLENKKPKLRWVSI